MLMTDTDMKISNGMHRKTCISGDKQPTKGTEREYVTPKTYWIRNLIGKRW